MDVKLKKLSIEQFVSALSLEELAELVNGHSGDATVRGVAGSTWRNDTKGITPVNLSDGPAGLRITQKYKDGDQTYYQYATRMADRYIACTDLGYRSDLRLRRRRWRRDGRVRYRMHGWHLV